MRSAAVLTALSLAIVSALPAQAQDPLELELVRAPRRLDTVSVAVVAVYDLRDDTTSIGEAQTGLTNKTRPVQLKGGAAAELQRFLQTRLPEREGARPVAIGLDFLLVSEQRTLLEEIARAEIALRFFEVRGDSLGYLASARSYTERHDGMDVTKWHDENVRGVLVDAVVRAAADGSLARQANEWRRRDELVSNPFLYATPSADGFASDDSTIYVQTDPHAADPSDTAAPSTYVAPGSITAARAAATDAAMRTKRGFVTFGPQLSSRAKGGVLAIGVRDTAADAWSVPFLFHAAILGVNDEERGVEGVFAYTGGAVYGVRRLNPSGLAFQFGGTVIGGSESYPDSDQERQREQFFLGGRLAADLAYYPNNTGVVATVGVFGSRLFGSELYPSDVGFTVNVGYQF